MDISNSVQLHKQDMEVTLLNVVTSFPHIVALPLYVVQFFSLRKACRLAGAPKPGLRKFLWARSRGIRCFTHNGPDNRMIMSWVARYTDVLFVVNSEYYAYFKKHEGPFKYAGKVYTTWL